MSYVRFNASLWTSDVFLRLTPEERYCMCYLLTNPAADRNGYKLNMTIMSKASGYNERTIAQVLFRLDQRGAITFDTEAMRVFVHEPFWED